jgi:formylglycine-generating enzyme required for sulfatase activity
MPRLCSVRRLLSASLLCCFPIVMGLLADAHQVADKEDDPRWIKLAVTGHRFEMEFARIPKGKFTMGSPKGEKYREDVEIEHEVEITRDYWLGKTEVTVGQFRAFVADTGYQTEAEKGDGADGWDADKRRAPGGLRELERREGVLRLARQEERQGDAATDRGGVGAGLSGRHADELSLRRRREGLAALREPGR